MNSPQVSIDTLIDQQHSQAERAEADARAIDERLARIPGSEAWLNSRKRPYGVVYNPWLGAGNLTAQGAILKHDSALASFLASKAGKALPARDYEGEAAQERLNASARAMERSTAEMRAQRRPATRLWTNAELATHMRGGL